MRVEFSAGIDIVTRAYPKLSRQLKKCAAYILEHPSEVATLSMRQLAARAGVPPSTMNRLAKALGFNTYDEFRALFRDSINEQATGYSLQGGQVHVVAREDKFDHDLNAFQQAALTNIHTLFDHIDRTALERATLPIGLAHGVVLKNPVRAGETVSWSDVRVDGSAEAVRVRREMEAHFGGSLASAAD